MAFAQTAPTLSQQAEMLRNLPPDQRNAILRMLQDGDTADPSLSEPESNLMRREIGEAELEDEEEDEPRLAPGDTLVVDITFPELTEEKDRDEVLEDTAIAAITGDYTYVLDSRGQLQLRGIAVIYLSGLTADEAAVRIASEPALEPFEVTVTILPLEPRGSAALQGFGYSIFDAFPSTFAPATDIPVPVDYVIGPGDNIIVQLFGADNKEHSLVVNRDGVLNFPEIGPLVVAGMTFESMRTELRERVGNQMIGVTASVTMGELRSIRVFVLGDVTQPGSYTVSGLSTMSNALFASGGVSEIGSLRNIQLKRDGIIVSQLDLYALLLNGNTKGDARLNPGDVIFVPTVGPRASVEGEVRRPAVYELRGATTAGELLRTAGGALPTADPRAARIERIDANMHRTIIDLNLSTGGDQGFILRDGDRLIIESVLQDPANIVTLEGHVERESGHAWSQGMRLTDLLPDLEVLLPRADTGYILVVRELSSDGRIETVSADLKAALLAPGSEDDIPLQTRDRVIVFDLETYRSRVVDPILDDLRMQAVRGEPTKEVRVGGHVRVPGKYPLEIGMTVSDLIRAGGGLSESAYTVQCELARFSIVEGQSRLVELIEIDLAGLLEGNTTEDIILTPYDFLNIKKISKWGDHEEVTLSGEVRFPGTYQILKGETLSSVLERAGGLTNLAFAEGSIFTRDKLRTKEQEQLAQLARRLELDLAAITLTRIQETVQAGQAVALGQSLVEQLRAAVAIGRLVIDVDALRANPGNLSYDIILQHGDELIVPEQTQEVTVIGEVQYVTSHIFSPGLSRDDYVNSSGGLTQKADKKRIYVVRANGSVLVAPSSKWFRNSSMAVMRPGDTVVVPLDADRVSKLTLATSISQVVFQLGVLAAAATR